MLDLGKSKKVTAVLKLKTQLSPKKDFFRIFNIAFWFVGIKTYQMTYVRTHVLSATGTQCVSSSMIKSRTSTINTSPVSCLELLSILRCSLY